MQSDYKLLLDEVRFDSQGLVTVVAQEQETREVLMVAYMNRSTLKQTLDTGLMTYWSRSRQCVWVKGKTSGQFQDVKRVNLDCDGDAILFEIKQHGSGACHTGARSCFHREIPLPGEIK